MCGIAAVLLHPQERPATTWQAIKNVFTDNLRFNEKRGKAATGLAIAQINGQITLHKDTLPATQFVNTPQYLNTLNNLGPQTTLLLGHTRLPTKGTPVNANNNHPLQVGPIFGVHNGHIKNDDQLFAHLSLPRQAQVDSEIIFRLMEPYSPANLNGQYLAAIRSKLQYLQGQFTFIACDKRAPNKLLVVRHKNPLSIHYHPQWNALIFSSSYVFLRKTFGRAVLTETVPRDQLMLFEVNSLRQCGYQPAEQLALYPKNGDGDAP